MNQTELFKRGPIQRKKCIFNSAISASNIHSSKSAHVAAARHALLIPLVSHQKTKTLQNASRPRLNSTFSHTSSQILNTKLIENRELPFKFSHS